MHNIMVRWSSIALLLYQVVGFQEYLYLPGSRRRYEMNSMRQDTNSALIVTDNPDEGIIAAAGARLGLEVYHALSQSPLDFSAPSLTLLSNGHRPAGNHEAKSIFVDQLIASDASPSIEDFQRGISSASKHGDIPILQVFLDRPIPALLCPQVHNAISFLGLTPIAEEFTQRVAGRIGSVTQQILDVADVSAAVSWDWNLHLALLSANTLPRSKAVDESFFVLPCSEATDMALIEYVYDYSRLGGTDSLLCETNEVSFQPMGKITTYVSYASATAYTALRGNGATALDAACIAYSVGLRFASEPPLLSPSANDVVQTTTLAKTCRDNLITSPVMRKRYIDFGYR